MKRLILYNGSPDAHFMSKNQVMVGRNEKLPEWHALDKKMTTEIVIMIVE